MLEKSRRQAAWGLLKREKDMVEMFHRRQPPGMQVTEKIGWDAHLAQTDATPLHKN